MRIFRCLVSLAPLFLLAGACSKPTEHALVDAAPERPACLSGTHFDEGVNGCVADTPAESVDAASPTAAAVEETEEEAELEPALPGKCPNVANLGGLYKLDWRKQFPLSPEVAARAKGIAGTAAETRAFAHAIENELRAACTKLANELGVKEGLGSSELACTAAATALKQQRGLLGKKTKVRVDVQAPVCTSALEPFGACLKQCDAALEAEDTVEVACKGQKPVGRCSGICEGGCDTQAGGKCPGTCTGSCSSGFHGACKGQCKGSCDGNPWKDGGCKGTCDGACDDGKGECKSACGGACSTHAAVCPSTCFGKCSVDVKEARCVGALEAKGATNECRAYCETRADKGATCTAGHVDVHVAGAEDQAAAILYEAALERHLGAIAKIARGMVTRIDRAANNDKIVSNGVKLVTQASDSEEIRAVTPCLSGFVKPVTEGSLSLRKSRAAALQVLAAAK